jgi:hypothetical protein
MKIRKRLGIGGVVLMISILISGTGTLSAETDQPGPFARMFRAIKHAFKEPHHQSVHRTHKQQSHEATTAEKADSQTPSVGTGTGSAPPTERNTRAATRAPGNRNADLSYGTPVPGKPGLVTSPYSPNSGYIDVRGFAPGTPVKDPYTGKIFLTP